MRPPADTQVGDDDVATVRAIAAGCEAAFARFYTAWFPASLVLAKAVSRRDEAFCLDVVQDVMLKVARRMPALRDAAAVRAWMAASVRNAITDRLRTEGRRRRRESAVARPLEHLPDLATACIADERGQWLAARIAELPELDRTLLLARFADDASVTASAAAAGIGADSAHGRLRRTLERLRRLAAEWWHG